MVDNTTFNNDLNNSLVTYIFFENISNSFFVTNHGLYNFMSHCLLEDRYNGLLKLGRIKHFLPKNLLSIRHT